jgi:uncharacterized lipoprotein YajG
MIKKSIYILLLTLLFTGCAERGSIVKITPMHKVKTKTSKTKDPSIPTLVLHNSREDKLKKNISGSLILIIGLILFL